MATPAPMNTAANREEVVRAAHAAGCTGMTLSIAGGLLLYSAMPDGEAKTAVEALAHRLDATYQCGCHIALGMAHLATTSVPELARSIASEPTAPAPKAKAVPKPKSRRR